MMYGVNEFFDRYGDLLPRVGASEDGKDDEFNGYLEFE
jgi:hypothetical protein